MNTKYFLAYDYPNGKSKVTLPQGTVRKDTKIL